MCVCVRPYLDGVSWLQGEGAVLSEDGQRTGEDSTQHPRQGNHPETHVLTHPGLQVIHDTPAERCTPPKLNSYQRHISNN